MCTFTGSTLSSQIHHEVQSLQYGFLMPIKAIIFDLDGTIADSSGCIVAAAQSTQKHLSLKPITDDAVRGFIGRPLDEMLIDLFDIEGDLVQKAVTLYSTEYVRLTKTEEHLFDGAIETLERLREEGLLLAIATGKSQRGAESATQRLGLQPWFDSIHGIIPGTPGKPHPAVLMRAMRALNVVPEDCVMVGDTTFDLDLAHAVGVRTIAVSWGVHSLKLLQSRSPCICVQTFDELLEWVLHQKSTHSDR